MYVWSWIELKLIQEWWRWFPWCLQMLLRNLQANANMWWILMEWIKYHRRLRNRDHGNHRCMVIIGTKKIWYCHYRSWCRQGMSKNIWRRQGRCKFNEADIEKKMNVLNVVIMIKKERLYKQMMNVWKDEISLIKRTRVNLQKRIWSSLQRSQNLF